MMQSLFAAQAGQVASTSSYTLNSPPLHTPDCRASAAHSSFVDGDVSQTLEGVAAPVRRMRQRFDERRWTGMDIDAGPSANGKIGTRAPVCETDDVSGRHADEFAQHDQKRRRTEKQSWAYVSRSGLAGGVAGCVAKTAIAPLDRVKILFQAQNPEYQKYSGKWTGVFIAGREIVRNDGVMALFQGHSATLLRIFPYAAIKYMAYDSLHFMLMPTKEKETSGRLFFAGAASGVTSVFITYPLELIRVRLAFETKRKQQAGSLLRIVRKIYTEGSTEAPFSGDARKRAGQRGLQSTSAQAQTITTTGAANLSTSAIQNAAIANGATAASPIPTSPIPTKTALATQRILQAFPILKFYRGFSVTVMGMIPYAGTSFLVFGRCKSLLQSTVGPQARAEGRESIWKPSKTAIDLSAGALAGAISQTAAYPFEVIRRRQQIGGIIRPSNILGVSETALWIWRTSGWRGFYVGLSIGFLKVVPMTSIRYVWGSIHVRRSTGS